MLRQNQNIFPIEFSGLSSKIVGYVKIPKIDLTVSIHKAKYDVFIWHKKLSEKCQFKETVSGEVNKKRIKLNFSISADNFQMKKSKCGFKYE